MLSKQAVVFIYSYIYSVYECFVKYRIANIFPALESWCLYVPWGKDHHGYFPFCVYPGDQ